VNGGQFKALDRAAQSSTGALISEELRQLIAKPALRISVYAIAGAALGIVLLMVVKPDLLGSVVILVIAGLIGGASAVLVRPLGERAAVTAPRSDDRAGIDAQ
jgi:hypothetical protein